MELIRGIHENEYGKMEGEVYFGYIKEYIALSFKKNVPMEYVQRTAEKLNELDDKLIGKLCEYSMKFYKDKVETYPDIVEDIAIEGDKILVPTDIMKYIEFGMLMVNLPEDLSDIGINLEGGCEWDENGIQWIVKGDDILYVGPWCFQNMWRADYEDGWNFVGVNEEC